MAPKEFIYWLRGFVQAANKYNITPSQWEDLKEMLGKVQDDGEKLIISRYTSETSGWGVTHTGGPADVSYGTENQKQLLKTEPIY